MRKEKYVVLIVASYWMSMEMRQSCAKTAQLKDESASSKNMDSYME